MPSKQRKNLADVRKPQGPTSETTPTYIGVEVGVTTYSLLRNSSLHLLVRSLELYFRQESIDIRYVEHA